ncbi:MAG: GGDEF domain-containing protein [Arenimonas sp.]
MLLDPRTALIIAALLLLINGTVLAYMRTDLPPDLRPATWSWQQGTILQAVGFLFFALQDFLPLAIAMPTANSFLLIGLTCYWHAIRKFNHQRITWAVIWPTSLGIGLILMFLLVFPSRILRVAIGSLTIAAIMAGCVWDLAKYQRVPSPRSGRLLIGVFSATALYMVGRSVYGLTALSENSSALTRSGLQTLTSLVLLVLQGVATTGFLLLCTERIRRQLERAVSTDFLTDTFSRRSITEAGSRAVENAIQHKLKFAVAIVDVDFFKRINDQYGHATGDLVLKSIADALRSVCRGTDLVGRLGGEEFAVLIEGADHEEARMVADSMRLAISSTLIKFKAEPIPVTASVGIACLDPEETTFDQVLQRADVALYSAKDKGRNCVVLA